MMSSPPSDRRERWWLASILAVAAALRLFRLGDANLWWDEALAVWAVRKGLVGATAWTAGDVHPPLYFWCLWGWAQLWGESPFALRSLSALIGTLTVWAVYGLGREVGGRRVGLWAAAFTAVAPLAIWWSQELRMYALAGLFCTLSWRYALQWLASERAGDRPDKRALALSALCSLGGLYTIFLSAAAMVAQALLVGLVWLVEGPRRRLKMLLRWAAAQAAVVALLVPWLAYSWGRMPTWSVAEPTSPWFVARLYGTLLVTGRSVYIEREMPAVVAVLAVLACGLVCWLRRRDPERGEAWMPLALALAVVVPGISIYLSTLPRSLFYTPHIEARYFYPFAPAFWALLAWAIVQLSSRWRWLGRALGMGVLALTMAYLPGYYRGHVLQDDLQSMVRTIISQAREGDMVLLDSGSRYPVFLYDYERLAPGAARPEFVTITRAENQLKASRVADWLDEHVDSQRRIWLAEVEVSITDPERLVRAGLAERLPEVASWAFGHNTLALYAADGQPPRPENDTYLPEYVTHTTLGGGELVGWDLPVRRLAAGTTGYLALQWASAPNEAVWLQVQAAGDRLVLRRCLPLAEGAVRMSQEIPFPAEWPRGRYTLSLTSAAGESLSLGDIRIVGERKVGFGEAAPVDASFDGLTLTGIAVDLPKHITGGEEITVDLAWRADAAVAQDGVVFVHVLGATANPATGGPLWAQQDAEPLGGQWPTTTWQPGDALLDRHVLSLPSDLPAGEYQLELGVYDRQTGERVTASTAAGEPLGDQLLWPGFTVR
ncbi:MAG: glycosyltransferase family 39 protein [Anaerolineales bacterium]